MYSFRYKLIWESQSVEGVGIKIYIYNSAYKVSIKIEYFIVEL